MATENTRTERLKFDELKVGMCVRYEFAKSRINEDEELGQGSGKIHQITPHLVVIDNGKYKTTATRIEMRLGRFACWAVRG